MAPPRLGLPGVVVLALSCSSCDAPPCPPLESTESKAPPRIEKVEEAEITAPSESPEPPTGPIHVTADVVRPERISGESPGFQLAGCEIRQSPIIIVQAVIDVQGRVQNVEFLKEPPGECAAQTIRKTLETWRFRPAQFDGRPVAVYYTMTVNIDFK